tara:strand:+ start:121 stop:567 length:447 start_codon:yes stop_codon:yes gene_type:complete
MKKIINYLIVFIFVASCSYEPVFQNTKSNIEFGKATFNGDEKISNLIYSQFKNYESNESKKVINFNSRYDKIVASKDKKGNPQTFNMKVLIELKIINENKNEINKIFEESISYNNIKSKFELKNKEDQLKRSLSENIIRDILVFINSL